MDELVAELRRIETALVSQATRGDDSPIRSALDAVEAACREISKAWSGSNMGYQSRVYYADLQSPPPGAHFDSEWGFKGVYHGTTGDWREWNSDAIKLEVWRRAGVDDLDEARTASTEAARVFDSAQSDFLSILATYLATNDDPLVRELQVSVTKLQIVDESALVQALGSPPSGRSMLVRDTTAFNQGFFAAPHDQVAAQSLAARSAFEGCRDLAGLAARAAAHIERQQRSRAAKGQEAVAQSTGTRVIIGHGRSLLWRELKDFVRERLHLEHDEFNRVPVAGVANIARLSEMLDNAAIALIVLTAEDETTEGEHRARENVVHEAGLFQGRLGFSRAILLVEDGCNEFSNIHGLGQIRFPAGNIGATFESVREVFEREGLIGE